MAAANAPDESATLQDWRAERVREWLLSLLRFAITHQQKDESAAFTIADELDSLGLRWRPAAPMFFRRTNAEVCAVITTPDDPRRTTVLRNHSARIDDARLRRAFEAAVWFNEKASPFPSGRRPRR